MEPKNKTEDLLVYIANQDDTKIEHKKILIEHSAYPSKRNNATVGACQTCFPPDARTEFVEHILRSLGTRYTVTIYIAYPGTPLNDNDGEPYIKNGKRVVSVAGHMWFHVHELEPISKKINSDKSKAFGFMPKTSLPFGDGMVINKDTIHYENPHYRRIIEISEEQHQQLLNYGKSAQEGTNPDFSLLYVGSSNSCIDFTWKSLRSASLLPDPIECGMFDLRREHCDPRVVIDHKRKGTFEGMMLVGNNIIHVRSIKDPYPHSELNMEIINDLPSDSILRGSDPKSEPLKEKKEVKVIDTPPSPNYGADQFFGDWNKYS
ncbi:hypothetical protein [Morganella psychrotolerans]|uniref:hypothetical protein n=1 Tax=Morganella psychrotolerans TaxID=368603 RepID=UPI0039AF56C9